MDKRYNPKHAINPIIIAINDPIEPNISPSIRFNTPKKINARTIWVIKKDIPLLNKPK